MSNGQNSDFYSLVGAAVRLRLIAAIISSDDEQIVALGKQILQEEEQGIVEELEKVVSGAVAPEYGIIEEMEFTIGEDDEDEESLL